MNRGSLVLIALPGDYGKPRPGLVIQSDRFASHPSVVVLPFTTEDRTHLGLRVSVAPTPENGLNEASRLMVDKVTTMPREKLGKHIGRLSDADLLRLNRALMVFLGLAGQAPN